MVRNYEAYHESAEAKKKKNQNKAKAEYRLKMDARFIDSIHKYERYATNIHEQGSKKMHEYVDEEEQMSSFLEDHYLKVISVFMIVTLTILSLLYVGLEH